ncbi:1-deoxy-D-xylulose-5-phosphate synthase [Chloroflexota bacterium]
MKIALKSRIMYVELKTYPGGHDDQGPARICRVLYNKSGKTLMYKDKRLQKGSADSCGNYHDIETGEGYWISGPKKNGQDRFDWAKRSPVEIDEDVREEYWTKIRNQPERKKEGLS